MREVVFDTETTGFDPATGDRLIEVGCVELIDGMVSGATYHQLVNPQRDIPAGAMAVHGITNEQVAVAPLFEAVVDEFLAFIGDAPLVAHNADFDFKFINAELARIGRPPLDRARMVDTLAIAKRRFPGARNSLDALAARLNVDASARTVHGALIDSYILADVYLELRGGKQRGLDLAAEPGVVAQMPAAPTGAGMARTMRHFAPSPAEIAAHELFIASIGALFWKGSPPAADLK